MANRKEQLKALKTIFDHHQNRIRALSTDDGSQITTWRIVADLRASVLSSVGSTIWTEYIEKKPPTL